MLSSSAGTDLLKQVLSKRASVREVAPGIFSTLQADHGAAYDGKAAAYDLLVGSPLYNRLVWRTRRDAYAEAAAQAVAAGTGPYLETGCGTSLFTHAVYRQAERPMVLLDRSVDMLKRARGRVGDGPVWLQGDLFDLPFADGAFETVCSFGVLHVLADIDAPLRGLWRCVAPGGTLALSSLIRPPHALGRAWYGALRLAGEVAPARTGAELTAVVEAATDAEVTLREEGSFAFVTVRRAD